MLKRKESLPGDAAIEQVNEASHPPPALDLNEFIAAFQSYLLLQFPPAFFVSMVFVVGSVGLYAFWGWLDAAHGTILAWAQRLLCVFLQLQIAVNVWAIQSQSFKDDPAYQMRRLPDLPPIPLRECGSCKSSFPIRSCHCRFCGRCTLRAERHQPLLGTCVGVATLRYQIALSIHLLLLGLLCSYWAIRYCWDDIFYLVPGSPESLTEMFIAILHLMCRIASSPISTVRHVVTWVFVTHLNEYLALKALVLSLIGLAIGALVTLEHVYLLYHGIAASERALLAFWIKGDDEKTTFAERTNFFLGSNFLAGMLWPRFSEDVEWKEPFIETIVTAPLLQNPKSRSD
ncbi:unnamed protein product, partial [Mesorhabditis spiculigera]